MENIGAKLFILHGYWNTDDTDGVTIVEVGPVIDPLQKKLNEIKENYARDYVELNIGKISISESDREYEITDKWGGYAKFYITEEIIPAINEYEYVAFIWDKRRKKMVPKGRSFGSEALCRARINEKIEKNWLPDYLDDSRVQICKRAVGTILGNWEVIE